nr:spe-17 [Caenorhabditis elegans]
MQMADIAKQREQPPRAMSTTSGSDVLKSTTTGTTTGTTKSSVHTSDTNYGVGSLRSDCSEEGFGSNLTPEEANWLNMARVFTKAEKPFKEQKTFRVARKLRTWRPRRSVTWSFLRRLYNGREDMKEDLIPDLADLEIEDKPV